MPPSAIKILVVDDDESQSTLISKFLTKHGYSVLTAVSPVEAMPLQHSDDIKLVITGAATVCTPTFQKRLTSLR